ncbi:uncharacterized protein isoform X3 [Rhodnius prolixus]|uniref:uncharacterized protein isoform X3 n=1 Tax=Rhodnius prolixus TaxID=13249 RepID=UPI003D18C9A3
MSQRSKMFKKSQMMTTEKPSASEIEIIESYGEDKGIDEYETLFLEQDVPEPGALIDSRLYKYVKWTETENSWRLLQIEAIEVVEKKKISDVIVSKFRDSFAGEMLYELNKQQPISAELQEKKLDIIKKNLMLNEFPNSYERLNYYVDDIVKLIDDCRKSNPDGIITLPLLVFKSPLLRFTHCQISLMNNCLLNCENLQALILASNYITDFPGSYLPRNLKMLELYANLLYKIDLLCTEPPQRMVYLGLGRNFLSLESETINLLLFQHLCHLDLSDNDFENMDELLETLPKLLKLQSLQLIGNPCSLAMNYVRKIQTALPTLSFLDGEPLNSTLVFEKDKNEAYLGGDACLQVHVFRIMGFRTDRRSKKKVPNQKFRMEIELPLLDMDLKYYETQLSLAGESADHIQLEESIPFDEWYAPRPVTPELSSGELKLQGGTKKTGKTKTRKPSKTGKTVKTRTSTESAKAAKQMPRKLLKSKEEDIRMIEQRYNNYLSRDRRKLPVKTKFISDSVKFANLIEFKNPCIEVPVPWYMLRKLRDTLRSTVILRLIEVENGNVKKAKKKNVKKNKKDKKDSEKEKLTNSEETESELRTVAKIAVPLEVIKWNVNHLGYMWDIKRFCVARPYPHIEFRKCCGRRNKVGRHTPNLLINFKDG